MSNTTGSRWGVNRTEGSEMATRIEGTGSGDPATAGGAGHGGQRSPIVWQVLSALVLLAMGGIHFYYVVFLGAGGLLGVLFVLNAIGGLVLAIAMLAARRRLLRLASLLSLLFMAGTLLALVLALTVGLLGIREQLGGELVMPTLVVESIGTIVLVVTAALVFRRRGA
jgi:hypothetical protein